MTDTTLRHLALIPDGNRRWSVYHGVSLEQTYFASCAKMLEVCEFLEASTGLLEVSLFYVSCENLRARSRTQLDPLFKAGHHFLDQFYNSYLYKKIDLRWVGMHEEPSSVDSALYPGFLDRVRNLSDRGSEGRRLNVVIAYDVRRDIEAAIDENGIFSYDRLAVNRPVDLIIRSGKRQRLSGFLPLMCQYSEFEFLDAFFPDVTLQEVIDCMRRFNARGRMFGS